MTSVPCSKAIHRQNFLHISPCYCQTNKRIGQNHNMPACRQTSRVQLFHSNWHFQNRICQQTYTDCSSDIINNGNINNNSCYL